MTTFTDTHCHLYLEQYDQDRDAVLQRAWEAGLVWILHPGIDLETSQAAVKLSQEHPGRINAAVGIHPNFGKPWKEDFLRTLRDQAHQPEVVAIGEIGLDYYRQHTPVEQQQTMFIAQLRLAAELSLPVVIHNRDSAVDMLATLSEWHQELINSGNPLAERPGVLHSYSADLKTAQKAIAMNFFIGISGPVTFKNAPERKSITKQLPLDHLLLETDAPYLAPHPHRGKRNEPAFIPLIAEEIARLHQTSVQEVAQVTTENASRLFNIKI